MQGLVGRQSPGTAATPSTVRGRAGVHRTGRRSLTQPLPAPPRCWHVTMAQCAIPAQHCPTASPAREEENGLGINNITAHVNPSLNEYYQWLLSDMVSGWFYCDEEEIVWGIQGEQIFIN